MIWDMISLLSGSNMSLWYNHYLTTWGTNLTKLLWKTWRKFLGEQEAWMRIIEGWLIPFWGTHKERSQSCNRWYKPLCTGNHPDMGPQCHFNQDQWVEFVIFASFLGTLHVNALHRDLSNLILSDLLMGEGEAEVLITIFQEHLSLQEEEGAEEEEDNALKIIWWKCFDHKWMFFANNCIM